MPSRITVLFTLPTLPATICHSTRTYSLHPHWKNDRHSWDPPSNWKIPIKASAVANSSDLAAHIPDHRGQQPFVSAAYGIEDYLARQPAHVAAQEPRSLSKLLLHYHSSGVKNLNFVSLFYQLNIGPQVEELVLGCYCGSEK